MAGMREKGRLGALLAPVLCVAIASLVAPAAQAKAPIATITTLPGPQSVTEAPKGLAVNREGAGGVSPGDTYVVNSPNNRVEVFSSAGALVRAFGYDAVAAGPSNTGADEQQSVSVDATGGSFALTIATGTTGFGDVTAGSNIIANVTTATGAFNVGDGIKGGCLVGGATITAVGAGSLTLSEPAGFTCPPHRALTAVETTAPIPFNATAVELESALTALPGIETGDVAVSGPSGGPFTVEFTGALGHNDVPQMSANSSGLTGGTQSATLTTTVAGGGFEVCAPVSNPADVCKAGSESAIAGGLAQPAGIAIDQTNGSLYITDAVFNAFVSNARVNVYSATGDFQGAFGWNVDATAPAEALQFCTTATGCKKGTPGTGSGQIANNLTSLPALDPTNGHLYLPDGSGARVQELAPTLNGVNEVTGVSFVKSFGWDVVASGPDQSNEIQRITVAATAGAFKLTFGAGGPGISETGSLKFDAGAKEVEDALKALTNISSAGLTVTVSGGPGNATGSSPYVITFESSPKGADVAPLKTTKAGLSGSAAVETFNDGGKGLEVCEVARGNACKAGVGGVHLTQFAGGTPSSLAVDSSGTVYAVDQSADFSGSGPCRLYATSFPVPGAVEVEEFAPAQLTFSAGTASAICATDVAVDRMNPVDPADDRVLVAKQEGAAAFKFLEFDLAGTLIEESPQGVLPAGPGGEYHGLAVGNNGRFYFSSQLGKVDVFGPPPAPAVTIGAVTGVGKTEATFHGTVTPPAPVEGEFFETSYHFEVSSDDFASSTNFPIPDASAGDGSGVGSPGSCGSENPPTCNVQVTATDLQPGAHYKVRLVATTGSAATSTAVQFETEAGAPTISGMLAEEIGQSTAKICGLVNPNSDATSYHFEWGTTSAYGEESPTASAGSGSTPVKVCENLSGLALGSAYHFRIVAENSSGETEGEDHEFWTLSAFGLPENRSPEQVSPNDKRPVGQVSSSFAQQVSFQAAADGDSTIYPLQNGLPQATAGGNLEYLGLRGSDGAGSPLWSPTQLTPPALVPSPDGGQLSDMTGRVRYASADLSCQLIESFEPLTADTPAEDLAQGVKNLYRRNADGSHTLLSAPVPLNLPVAAEYHVDWASGDCSHVLFDTQYRLLAGAASEAGLYEWADGVLRLAGVLPDGSVASGAVAGASTARTNVNSLSVDGDRVFFSAISNEGGDNGRKAVFLREGGTDTVDVSQSQTGVPNDNGKGPTEGSAYQLAAADGSHVFFTSRYGLAPNGSSKGASSCANNQIEDGTGCDLYSFDVEAETLTDLSADANPADAKGAGVVGVLDVSEDGSHVYFAARGQLLAGKGKTETQNRAGKGSFNVYLSKGGALSFVGLIGAEDADPDAFSGTDLVAANHTLWVADATPDGSHLLFVSGENLSGFDGEGATMAYLYSVDTGKVECVSCPAAGQKTVAGAKFAPIATLVSSQNGESLLSFLQRRPRSLSDDGERVFFRSPDVLAPGAREGKRNIYEWQGGQVYLLLAGEEGASDLTRYADSSASGDDVFVVTKAKLIPQDFDNTLDLYDLRSPHTAGEVVGPGPVTQPVHICNPETNCQEGPKPPPLPGVPASSEAPTGEGNPPLKKPKPRHPNKGKGKKGKHKKSQGKHHKRASHTQGRATR